MLVVDTSAVLAILLDEPQRALCRDRLESDAEVAISAGTLAEALIITARRGVRAELEELLQSARPEAAPVDERGARLAGAAYDRWGRGMHPAGLNYGDCFAYALAKERGCPLLFVGDDFAGTDIVSALA